MRASTNTGVTQGLVGRGAAAVAAAAAGNERHLHARIAVLRNAQCTGSARDTRTPGRTLPVCRGLDDCARPLPTAAWRSAPSGDSSSSSSTRNCTSPDPLAACSCRYARARSRELASRWRVPGGGGSARTIAGIAPSSAPANASQPRRRRARVQRGRRRRGSCLGRRPRARRLRAMGESPSNQDKRRTEGGHADDEHKAVKHVGAVRAELPRRTHAHVRERLRMAAN